jgi:hypothetical protein
MPPLGARIFPANKRAIMAKIRLAFLATTIESALAATLAKDQSCIIIMAIIWIRRSTAFALVKTATSNDRETVGTHMGCNERFTLF